MLNYNRLAIYVIGLHAVQFGNNWNQKIPRIKKLDSAYAASNFGCPQHFSHPIISILDSM